MFLKRLQDKFQEHKIPFAIVAGYAVAIHGVARGTFDLDIITELSEENLTRIERAFLDMGLKATIPLSAKEIFQNRLQLQKDKNLIAWNFVNPIRQRENIDIILIEDIRDSSIVEAKTDFGTVPVIGLEDLIRMKSNTGRTQDQEDIKALRLISKSP